MSMRYSGSRHRHRGFTLIEVLVAILIFSIGLIGLGATMALSIRSNNVAGYRTQAVFLAESLLDMMRANGDAVWDLAYDGNYPSAIGVTCAGGCTAAQLAQRDRGEWSTLLQRVLPNGSATVECVLDMAVRPEPEVRRPPAGLCTLSLTWTENVDVEGSANGLRDQSFVWVVNP